MGASGSNGTLSPLAARYLEAVCDASLPRARQIVRQARDAGMSPTAIHDEIIAPALYEVGRQWERGHLGVADEHLASDVTHRTLNLLYELMDTRRPGSRPPVLLAAAPGEQHIIGLRMAADVLEALGHTVLFLGANTPIDALLDAVARQRPALVCLSVTMPTARPGAAVAVRTLREAGVPLVIGGQASDPGWEADGVVVLSGTRRMPQVVNRLLSRPA